MTKPFKLKHQLLQATTLSDGQVRGRYAPSPSGAQHMGNIQSAVIAWLQARLVGGEFALRMDDIDTPRIKAGSAQQIIDDLRWLGLDWDVLGGVEYAADSDGIYVESNYLATYDAVFQSLQQQAVLYPCICSRKDIRSCVATANEAGHYVYPGTCRGKPVSQGSPDQQQVWRFIVPDTEMQFVDVLAGKQTQNVADAWGDIIVKRFNAMYAYQLVSVVDDIKMGISDVVRGADLLESTAGQIALFQALGAQPPRFWHAPIKRDAKGEKLAKRDGSESLLMLRQAGSTPAQLIGRIGFELGLIESDEGVSLQELLQHLRAQDYSTASG
jgi:glutamyl-tRNA synthetase